MSGTISPLTPYAFMAWCSVKAQRQLYFYREIETQEVNNGLYLTPAQMFHKFYNKMDET